MSVQTGLNSANNDEDADLELIRDTEAAELLDCSLSTFWRRVGEGIIKRPMKFGGTSRWFRKEIRDVIKQAAAERDAETQIIASGQKYQFTKTTPRSRKPKKGTARIVENKAEPKRSG